MNSPFFSIITVCKNEEKKITRTIESLRKQVYRNYEHIIVDGLSTDDTVKNISKTGWLKDNRVKMISEQDDGVYYAMNKGINSAKGEYIYFLNAGDELYDCQVLKKVYEELKTARPDVFVGTVWFVQNLFQYAVRPSEPNATFPDGKGYFHQGVFANRECFLDGGFDTKFRIHADYDWECRQYKQKTGFYISDIMVSVFYGNGLSGLLSLAHAQREEMLRIWEKYFPELYQKHMDNRIVEWERKKGNIRTMLLHELLDLTIKGIQLTDYIDRYGSNMAIYGYGEVGQCLYEKLRAEGKNDIVIIDKSYIDYSKNSKLYRPDEDLPKIDLLIVTVVVEYYEIKRLFEQRYHCAIISIEELINSIYENEWHNPGECIES